MEEDKIKLDVIVLEDNEAIRELLDIVLTTEHSNVYSTDIAEDVVMRKADIYVLDNDINGQAKIGDMCASVLKHHYPDSYLVSHSARNPKEAPEGLYNLIIQKPTGIMTLKNIILNYEELLK